ncbi:MAG: LapA family protein [Actinocrinis sp.]
MSGVPPVGAPTDEPEVRERGSMVERLRSPKTVGGLAVVALAVWFILANTSHTRIHFWFAWVTAQLWMVLAGTFLAGILVGFLTGRRRRERKERD